LTTSNSSSYLTPQHWIIPQMISLLCLMLTISTHCNYNVFPPMYNTKTGTRTLHQTNSQVKTSTHHQMQCINDKTIPGQNFQGYQQTHIRQWRHWPWTFLCLKTIYYKKYAIHIKILDATVQLLPGSTNMAYIWMYWWIDTMINWSF